MIKRILMNFLLAMIWVALTGKFLIGNFIFGMVLAYGIMWFMYREDDEKGYFKKIPQTIAFIFYFFYKLLEANIQVAYDVITPKFHMTPGIVAIPLKAKTDLEITLLSNIITMTPGTLALDVSDNNEFLFVHSMYIKSKEDFIHDIKDGFERRLLEILR